MKVFLGAFFNATVEINNLPKKKRDFQGCVLLECIKSHQVKHEAFNSSVTSAAPLIDMIYLQIEAARPFSMRRQAHFVSMCGSVV